MAAPIEEYQLSDSEVESDIFDPYECDPVFENREELDQFMKSCNVKPQDSDEEDIDYNIEIKKVCSCNNCI